VRTAPRLNYHKGVPSARRETKAAFSIESKLPLLLGTAAVGHVEDGVEMGLHASRGASSQWRQHFRGLASVAQQ